MTAQYRDKFTTLVHPSHLSRHPEQGTRLRPRSNSPLSSAGVPAVCGGAGSTLRPVNDGEPGDPERRGPPDGAPHRAQRRSPPLRAMEGPLEAMEGRSGRRGARGDLGGRRRRRRRGSRRAHPPRASPRSSRRGEVSPLTGSSPAPPSGRSTRPPRASSAAHGLLSSPLLWPVDVLPVAGRQLRSVQDLSGAAEQVARTGITAVGTVPVAAPSPPHSRTRPGRGAASARRARIEHAPRPGRGRPWPRPGPHRPPGTRADHVPQRPHPGAHDAGADLRRRRRGRRRSFRDPGPTCCWPGTTPRCGRALVPSSRPGS